MLSDKYWIACGVPNIHATCTFLGVPWLKSALNATSIDNPVASIGSTSSNVLPSTEGAAIYSETISILSSPRLPIVSLR